MRNVTLTEGEYLWEKGDVARYISVLDSGRLGVYSDGKLVGLVTGGMVIGESALGLLEGLMPMRSAAVKALEKSSVTEFSASNFKSTFEGGKPDVGRAVLTSLIAQICRNNLLVLAAQSSDFVIAQALRGQVKAFSEVAPACRAVKDWGAFTSAFNYLATARDHSDTLRDQMVRGAQTETESLTKASGMLKDLVSGTEVAAAVESFLAADREKQTWFTR
jgi:CRP-like cAMP-binding protein